MQMGAMEMTRRIAIAFGLVVLSASQVLAWTTVGTGIEYQKYALSGPTNVYVARMLRSETAATIESSLPQGKLTGARETVRASSARLDDAINWWGRSWGKRNRVVVAVNGDWTRLGKGPPAGQMHGGQVHSGWYCKALHCEYGGGQFVWTHGRVPFICGGLGEGTQALTISYPSATQKADGVNRPRNADELIIYTPQYSADTATDADGVEVLVEVSQPTQICPLPGKTMGTVRGIRRNQGSTPIPFDHVVLSASGSAAATLLANVAVGAKVGISQLVSLKETPEFNWQDTYSSISGGRLVVANGAAVDNSEDAVYRYRHPRTAVAYNKTHVFLIVCDGRSKASIGMSSSELAGFIISELGGTEALMLDGGGSSTMVVKGEVVNVPSDGPERPVGNGLLMVNVRPKLQSKAFRAGQQLAISADATLRLGPGSNYASVRALAIAEPATVVAHPLNGVFAKGCYWWKASIGETVGWIPETSLSPAGR